MAGRDGWKGWLEGMAGRDGWKGWLERNQWHGIEHIKHMVSMCLITLHPLHSSHYYEASSPQQPPVIPTDNA
jgi:hypothetical protein